MCRDTVLFALFLSFLTAVRGASFRSGGLSSLRDAEGISGEIRALFVTPDEAEQIEPGITPHPGVRPLPGEPDVVEIVLTPFASKVGGRLGNYVLGRWPFEDRPPIAAAYADPRGFVEVTPETASLHVSRHFTLGQFLTKNQQDVWPKYIVLEPRLLDKLELTIAKLRESGYPVRSLFVMSGFRTPEYNALDLGPKARSSVSRHLYGDAADVYPDDSGKGVIDDLNRDGRIDLADARIVAQAAEAVEIEHPSLVGGIGIYPGTRAHGPFVHIDVRGRRARWNG